MIRDFAGVEFLQWCLPRMHLRWLGFRKVRNRIYKRLNHRLLELGLPNLGAYRVYLEDHADEWKVLGSLCWMPITRFYRDRSVYQQLEAVVLPQLAQLVIRAQENNLRCWSAGCAGGEEPYTLAIIWQRRLAPQFPEIHIRVVATDIDPQAIQRAHRGRYHWSSMKELPAEWRAQAFVASGEELCLKDEYHAAVTFLVQDLRESVPDGLFQLILCRNLAFTYFDEASQRETLERLTNKLTPGGALIIGKLESLPEGEWKVEPWSVHMGVYRKHSKEET